MEVLILEIETLSRHVFQQSRMIVLFEIFRPEGSEYCTYNILLLN